MAILRDDFCRIDNALCYEVAFIDAAKDIDKDALGLTAIEHDAEGLRNFFRC